MCFVLFVFCFPGEVLKYSVWLTVDMSVGGRSSAIFCVCMYALCVCVLYLV